MQITCTARSRSQAVTQNAVTADEQGVCKTAAAVTNAVCKNSGTAAAAAVSNSACTSSYRCKMPAYPDSVSRAACKGAAETGRYTGVAMATLLEGQAISEPSILTRCPTSDARWR